MIGKFIGYRGAKQHIRRLGKNRKCLHTVIGRKKLNKKPRTIVVRTGVVIQASTTCSMLWKLVPLLILLRMCATDAALYGSETSAPEQDTKQIFTNDTISQ